MSTNALYKFSKTRVEANRMTYIAHRRYPHVCTRCPESPWQQSYSGLTVYPRAIRRDFLHIYIYIYHQPDSLQVYTQPSRIGPSAGLRPARPPMLMSTHLEVYIYTDIQTCSRDLCEVYILSGPCSLRPKHRPCPPPPPALDRGPAILHKPSIYIYIYIYIYIKKTI